MNPVLGDIKASKLTSAQVKQYMQQRLKKVKPSTVNRELEFYIERFNSAINKIHLSSERVPYFPKLTESEPRKGFLKPEHYRNLLSELPQELKLLFVIAYHVGLRKGALLRIKCEQVDLGSSCIWMEGKKANRKPEPVAVPIYGDMRLYIEMQPHTSEYLFARGSVPIKDFRMSWNVACPAAGVPCLLFHDLRRTAVRNLRRAGVAESVMMKITGHRTRGVFERYNITDQTDTLEAGKMAEEFLNQAHAQDSSQISSQNRRWPN